MYYPTNDTQYAHDRLNDRLREAEHDRLVHSLRPQQPNPFHQLEARLVALVDKRNNGRIQRRLGAM